MNWDDIEVGMPVRCMMASYKEGPDTFVVAKPTTIKSVLLSKIYWKNNGKPWRNGIDIAGLKREYGPIKNEYYCYYKTITLLFPSEIEPIGDK